jgi:hypothetical protein
LQIINSKDMGEKFVTNLKILTREWQACTEENNENSLSELTSLLRLISQIWSMDIDQYRATILPIHNLICFVNYRTYAACCFHCPGVSQFCANSAGRRLNTYLSSDTNKLRITHLTCTVYVHKNFPISLDGCSCTWFCWLCL